MKILLLFFPFLIFTLGCQNNSGGAKFIVTTTVEIQAGKIDNVLQLFKETNPALVQEQDDWVKAVFSKSDESNSVMVQAYWKNKASYIKFKESEKYKSVMKDFGQYFAEKPNVKFNEILFEM